MSQLLLAAAREFLAAGPKGDAGSASGAQSGLHDQLGWLAGLLQAPGGRAASDTGWLAADFLAQAWMVAMLSGFRYWRRLAQLYDGRAALFTQFVAAGMQNLAEQEQRRLIEELRSLMREAGDAASQEARRFEAELDRLSLALAVAATGDTAADPHRYARAKP